MNLDRYLAVEAAARTAYRFKGRRWQRNGLRGVDCVRRFNRLEAWAFRRWVEN